MPDYNLTAEEEVIAFRAAFNELDAHIDELIAEIARLQKENATLRADMQRLLEGN